MRLFSQMSKSLSRERPKGLWQSALNKSPMIHWNHSSWLQLLVNKYFPLIELIEKLANTNPNFKYIVNIALLAKGGNGFDMGGLSYCNSEMDGSVAINWQNKHLNCLGVVYGISTWLLLILFLNFDCKKLWGLKKMRNLLISLIYHLLRRYKLYD